jgi:hypothetical protein
MGWGGGGGLVVHIPRCHVVVFFLPAPAGQCIIHS